MSTASLIFGTVFALCIFWLLLRISWSAVNDFSEAVSSKDYVSAISILGVLSLMALVMAGVQSK